MTAVGRDREYWVVLIGLLRRGERRGDWLDVLDELERRVLAKEGEAGPSQGGTFDRRAYMRGYMRRRRAEGRRLRAQKGGSADGDGDRG